MGNATVVSDRYRLDRIIGSGGSAVVHAATDRVLDRAVALKILADNLALDDAAVARFEREARAAASVVHPNVVRVFDVGTHDERPYLVMELIEGRSLQQELGENGPLAPDEVEHVARHLLAGLQRVHDAGVLHRDIKPGNLLRDHDGGVKLTDFGVADMTGLPGLTQTGIVMGTRHYLAPERARGEPATIASDLFGVGATLHTLLTGQPPAGAITDHLPTATSSGLQRLVVTCLAADAQRRPASAETAAALLDQPTTRAVTTEDLDSRSTGEPTARLPTAELPGDAATHRIREREADTEAAAPPTEGSETGATPPPTDGTDTSDHPSWRPIWPRVLVWIGLLTAVGALVLLLGLPSSDSDTPPDQAPPAEVYRDLGDWLTEQGSGN